MNPRGRSLAGGALTGSTPFVRFGIVQAGHWVDAAAERMAREADAVVLAVGFDTTTELEDWDRTFALPPGQNELIQKITTANKNATRTNPITLHNKSKQNGTPNKFLASF